MKIISQNNIVKLAEERVLESPSEDDQDELGIDRKAFKLDEIFMDFTWKTTF